MAIKNPHDVTSYNPMRKNENVLISDFLQMVRNYNTKLKPLQLLVVAFSDGDQAYRAIKTVGELQMGIVTQGLASNSIYKKVNDQFVSNVLLKVNTKLGGRNFALNQANQLLRFQNLNYRL